MGYFILLLLAPYWLLALAGFSVAHETGASLKSATSNIVTNTRMFYAYYTPFVWSVILIIMGINPVMFYVITVLVAYVMSAHLMDRYRVPIWKRVIYSLASIVLIGFVLYKSNLFRAPSVPTNSMHY